MSIYEGRTGLTDYEDVHQPLVARSAQVALGDSSAEPRDWLCSRKAKPIDRLLPVGGRWLDRLPRDVYPSELATQYPRIVNLVAMHWNDRGTCPAYFEELLIDRRGGRHGFPADVRRDLSRLRDHWYAGAATPEG